MYTYMYEAGTVQTSFIQSLKSYKVFLPQNINNGTTISHLDVELSKMCWDLYQSFFFKGGSHAIGIISSSLYASWVGICN